MPCSSAQTETLTALSWTLSEHPWSAYCTWAQMHLPGGLPVCLSSINQCFGTALHQHLIIAVVVSYKYACSENVTGICFSTVTGTLCTKAVWNIPEQMDLATFSISAPPRPSLQILPLHRSTCNIILRDSQQPVMSSIVVTLFSCHWL